MLKLITLLSLVFALQASVKSNPIDILLAHERCFLGNCQSTFTLGIPYPICGTDNNPYHNWNQLDCSNLCAKNYGFEVRGNFMGLCPGKINAYDYWNMRKAILG